jgi:hypothetical protein
MEPVSPELVLVDPDLARRVRAAPAERPRPGPERTLGHRSAALPAAGADVPAGPTRAFKRLGALLLGTGLMASGFLAASAISGANSEPQPVSPPDGGAALAPDVVTESVAETAARRRPPTAAKTTVRARPGATPRRGAAHRRRRPATAAKTTVRARPGATPRRGAPNRRSNASKRRKQTAAEAAATTRAAVERKLLSVIVQSPAGKLPPALIDGKTGLAKNNLQAVCRPRSNSRSFACVVTSVLRSGAPLVYAHYRPTKTGRGGFTWYRSRRN